MENVFIRFDEFQKRVHSTNLWQAMVLTRENSPYHRELNVAVHTQMVLTWYRENLSANRSNSQRLLTLTAALFHDIAKPVTEIIKTSEERGEYRAYHGHELVSARMWVNFAMSCPEVRSILQFTDEDIAFVALMIEHHVPFSLKNAAKRSALKTAFYKRKGEVGHRAWLDLLLSDQHGRISDDQAEKLRAVDQWMYGWQQVNVVE